MYRHPHARACMYAYVCVCVCVFVCVSVRGEKASPMCYKSMNVKDPMTVENGPGSGKHPTNAREYFQAAHPNAAL